MARVLLRGITQRDITVMQGALVVLVAMIVAAEAMIRLASGRPALGLAAAASAWPMAPTGARAGPPARLRAPGEAAQVPLLDLTTRVSIAVAVAVVVATIAAPVLARFPPDLVLLDEIQVPPSLRHWMGTDASGRDLFSRLLYAGRVTMVLALASALAAVAAASVLAAPAAGTGRWPSAWEDVGVGIVRTVAAIPAFVLALAVISVAGRALSILGTIFAVAGLVLVFPSLRGLAAGMRAWRFVDAGRSAGASPLWIGERHVLPHLARPLAAAVLGLMPMILLLEATLGFFGFSVAPTVPTWGTMLWRGREALHRGDWWLLAFPMAFVWLASWGFGRAADGLREPAPPTYLRAPRLVLGQEWGTAATRIPAGQPGSRPARAAAAPAPAARAGGSGAGANGGASG
jgi:peptide/nickel transport system permease protein